MTTTMTAHVLHKRARIPKKEKNRGAVTVVQAESSAIEEATGCSLRGTDPILRLQTRVGVWGSGGLPAALLS
ncbi:hypothetical protein EYF80_050903 [Liparis tanakae]|uniref:Uncharacterized protein n=1 Tax=Liparis tanakae TaxID=230148 RepID=A0A4Z2FDT6_9TELE|nr:hypothetical protein EYF80_050903 [Liparis tanakae]